MKMPLTAAVSIVAVILIIGCSGSSPNVPVEKGSPDGRILSVDLTVGDGGFETSFNAAKELRVQALSIVPSWNEIEKSPEVYDPLYIPAANQFVPAAKMSATLGVNPIDTMVLRMPSDLQGKKFNDPEVIERYKKAVDFYLSQAQNVKAVSFVAGNEIDVYLGTDQARWKEFEEFFKAVAPHIRSKLPGVPVGVKLTHLNLVGQAKTYAQSLNRYADAVMVTYYPLNNDFSVKPPNVVRSNVEEVIELYPGKPIYFLEFGYPSSPILNSSEEKQAEFVKEMFLAWDTYNRSIPIISFFGMSDFTEAELDRLEEYYGIGSTNFLEYLGTLGLLNSDGTRKLAFSVFKEEASARGW